jgi:hypothetical protein
MISLLLIFFINLSGAQAGDWTTHEINLRSYTIRIQSGEEELRDLIKKKNANTDPSLRDKYLEQIKKKQADVQRLYDNFRDEKDHILYEHPEQGDMTERKYKHLKPKTLEELENESGTDGKLSRLKAKVEKTYRDAVPTPTPFKKTGD